MARKKAKRAAEKIRSNKDMQVVVLLLLSILSGILIYVQSGYIGENLSPILGGVIGWIKYIIPIGIFLVAINVACDKDRQYLSTKLFQYGLLLVCISILITVLKGNIDVINSEFEEAVKSSYDEGIKSIGGGAIGTIFAYPLIKLIGKIGTVILAVGIGIISGIFLYGIKPAEYVKEKVEERELEREEREKTRYKEEKTRFKEEKLSRRQQKEMPEPEIEIKEEKEHISLFGKKDKKQIEKENSEILDDQIKIKIASNDIEESKTANGLFTKQEETKEDRSKEVLTLEHALTVEDQNYEFPPIELLKEGKASTKSSKKAIQDTASKLQRTLYSFGVSAKVENVSVGPTITRYELKPAEGVRVNKIANLSDDIALSLAAESIRIEAPIPGKQAVGIEIPNKEKEMVALRDIIDTKEFRDAKSKLTFALGKDAAGEVVTTDIAKMPHVLIAGSTGSGKSVCINTLITSIIYKAKPSEVKLVMVDPKVVELSIYNGIPHLLIPVVTDPKKAAGALAWAVQEMENRYHLFAEKNVREIEGYNQALEKEGLDEKLPQIVIIIDELADLMMVASKDVEEAICRLAQKARAAGMHLVIATQRPSVDVITGLIKANIATRIAFAVTSQIDSRTILDVGGAEKLLGKGDMLFAMSGGQKKQRVQCAYISDGEVESIVEFLKANGGATYSEDVLEKIEKANSTDKEIDEDLDDDTDPFLMEAIESVIEMGQASASYIQRKFKVGYARAARIIDQMEERGIISGYEGSKPRKVLMPKDRWEELKMSTTTSGQDTNNEE